MPYILGNYLRKASVLSQKLIVKEILLQLVYL